MKYLLASSLFFMFSCYAMGLAQLPKNLFTNGSFNGPKGEDQHGNGWLVSSTPDLNDAAGELQTSTGYTWIKRPVSSFNGGTWQNLYSDREYLEQTVQVEKGHVYSILFEYASQGITSGSYTFSDPCGIHMYINGALVYTTPDDATPYTWENTCYHFIAPSSTITLRFSASKEQYVGLDGASLYEGNFCERIP